MSSFILLLIAGDLGSAAAEPSRTSVDDILRSLKSGDKITAAERQTVVGAIEQDDTQIRLCRALDAILQLDDSPREFLQAVAVRFDALSDADRDLYAKSKAAAILVKWRPQLPAASAWMERMLDDESQTARLLAASAIGRAGAAGKAFVSKLKRRLDDESAAVRVVAAGSLLQLTGDAEIVTDALLASLSVEPEAIALRPRTFSEWVPDHRHVAAGILGRFDNQSEAVALALCGLLRDEDETLLWIALRSLASLGCRSERVLDAIRNLRTVDNPAIVRQRRETLEALKP